MSKRNTMLSSAIAALVAAGVAAQIAPAQADEPKTDAPAEQAEKHGCGGKKTKKARKAKAAKAHAGEEKSGCHGKEGCGGGATEGKHD